MSVNGDAAYRSPSPTPSRKRRIADSLSPPKTWPRIDPHCGNGAVSLHDDCSACSPIFLRVPPSPMSDEEKNGLSLAALDYRRLTNSAPLCNGDQSRCRKPECSYAVLIGIAMHAAQSAGYGPRLPVIEIYRFIEKEFPFFRKCNTTGWKNCVRHCLSLGQFFRKVERSPTESSTAKGNLWEVIPGKKPFLERDIENFILEEYKKIYPLEETECDKRDSKTIRKQEIRKEEGSSDRLTGKIHSLTFSVKTVPPQTKNNQTNPQTTVASATRNGQLSPCITPCTGERSLGPCTEPYDEEDPLPHSVRSQVKHADSGKVSDTSNNQSVGAAKNGTDDVTFPRNTNASVVTKGDRNGFVSRKVSFCNRISKSKTKPELLRETLNKQTTQFVDNDENEASPFINNNHPVVNRGTLALINTGAAVSNRAGSMMTSPNFVTYVVAQTPMMWLMSDICTPTSSGLTATRMSHSIFPNTTSSTPPPSTISMVVKTSSSAHRRRIQPQRDDTPPELRPVLVHMHDASHFLPSSRFYQAPPYEDNRLRRTNCGEEFQNEREASESGESNLSCFPEDCKAERVDVLKRFGEIAALSVANSNQDNKPGCTTADIVNLKKGDEHARNSVHISPIGNGLDSASETHRQTLLAREKCYGEKFRACHSGTVPQLLGNGQAMLSSVQDITSLISGVASHTYLDGNCDEDEAFFEVANEWMELTIAREEEVMSSEFEEMTSSTLDDVYVYLDL